MNIRKTMNENAFAALLAAVSAGAAYKYIGSAEGIANLMETQSLTLSRVAIFLIIILGLTKLLAGLDKDIKADLFATPENTTKTWIALVVGIALVMMR